MADEEMLPPPRRTQLATNADFRKLLETPRAERGGDEKPSRPRKQQDAQKPKRKPQRPKPEPEKVEDDGSAYRDRAEERRKGVNPDYERVTTDLANLVGSSINADLNHISVEDSKYLGGDVDHTHLVKGLDYALLQKVRGEMTKEEEEEEERADEKAKKPARETEVVKFKSAAGRAIFNCVFTRQKPLPNQHFLPGRTAFVYELDEGLAPDVPMTLRRSKADCPVVVEAIKGGMDASVLERMVKIMSYMRGTSGKPGKLKKKDKLRMLQMMDGVAVNGSARQRAEEPAKRNGPADADEDIFGGVGRDYVPELPAARGNHGASKRADRMDVDDEMPPPPPPPPAQTASVGPSRPSGGYDAASAAYAAYGGGAEDSAPPPPPPGDDEDLELDRLAGLAPPPPPKDADKPPADARTREAPSEIIRKDTEDAYEECYPDYGGFNAAVVDSDDEDLTHMDSKEGKSRYDFDTEEQWEKYKLNKEMLPKAAFQFGVKMTDGRKGHKQLGKAVEQKEQKQLRQIQSMLKKNHGETYSHAFGEGKQEKEGAPVPSKRRRI